MNYTPMQYQEVEANLERLQARMPGLCTSSILLSRLLLHLGRGIANKLEREIRPFQIAEPEFRVLATLFSQPEGSAHPCDLCTKTSLSPANMSRISDTLVTRDLITRVSSMQDRRKMVLRITAQGEELVRRLLPKMWSPLCEIFVDCPEEVKLQLIAHLKAISTKLDRSTTEHVQECAKGMEHCHL